MKKLRLLLMFVLIAATVVLTSSCVDLSAYGINIPGFTQTCTVHRDINKDTICDVCGSTVPVNCTNHVDLNHDGVCDTNGCSASLSVFHYDEDHDGECDEELCTKTGMKVTHVDDNMDRKCDECGKKIDLDCECFDEDEDGYCDECGYEILPCEHVDEDGDGECDECGEEVKEPCDECVDSNKDGKCDECGNKVEAAPSCDHEDANFDGKCDSCKEKMDGVIPIYENGKLNYVIVPAKGMPSDQVMAIDQLINQLKNLGINASRVADTANTVTDKEILIGVSDSRGDEYKLDPHDYGPKGYAVQFVGSKIVVVFGSDNAFADAMSAFKETFLGITTDSKRLTSRFISEAQNIDATQDDYDVSTITLFGKDIKGFTIAANKTETKAYETATLLQSTLYTKTGYWLDIVPVDEADKSIIIAMAPKNVEREGFYATFTDGKMEFIAEYPTIVQGKVMAFFNTALASAKASGTLAIEAKDSFVSDVRYVYYKDYGAVGDGKTDDSEAIRAAHEYANAGGHKVIAQDAKTYYIGKMQKTISIRTDVDWGTAKFFIDDKLISPGDNFVNANGKDTTYYRSISLFTIDGQSAPSFPDFSKKIKEINASGGIDASTFTSFEVELGRPLLIRVHNAKHKNYIRYGVNANSGATQQEVLLLDEHGNIDPSTPFMFDYEEISSVYIYVTDDEPITIEGGEFYTSPWLQDTETSYTSYARGIKCSRSNVTFKGIKHYLVDEGDYSQSDHQYKGSSVDYGCPYGGFFTTKLCDNIRYYQCMPSAHITYWQTKGAGMGTYDIDPGDSTNIVYEECYQTDDNYFNASGQSRWGVMGSSGNKNVTFLNSKLTRFDAHNGIHNATIIGSTIKMIRVDGTGTFRMENSIHYTKSFFGLREDYGGFWHGNVILKNNKIYSGQDAIDMFTNTWYNHDFGYPTAYPTNIIIDGLEIYNADGTAPRPNAVVTLFGAGILSGASNIMKDYLPVKSGDVQLTYSDGTPVLLPNKNQTPPIERVVIRNCQQINWVLPDTVEYPWFESTVFSINKTSQCTEHFDFDGDLKCDDCGGTFTPCTEHVDRNKDGRCCYCYKDVEIECDKHIDKDLNAKCDICKEHYVCTGHLDENSDRICELCGGVLGCKDGHTDAKNDGYCDLCTKLIPTCKDGCQSDVKDIYGRDVADAKCDKCGADMVATITPCESCTDENSDNECDACHKDLTPPPATE